MTMPVVRMNAPRPLSQIVRWEDASAFLRSRETVTVAGGEGAPRELPLGAVLGRRRLGAPTISPDAGNAGDGAVGNLDFGPDAKVGTYVLTCMAAAPGGGTFALVDPDGYRLADVAVGVPHADRQLAFDVAAGGTDFAVGDRIAIEIDAGDGAVVQLDPAATDGTQRAIGILTDAVTAPDGVAVPAPAIVRKAVVSSGNLPWPDGITEDQKAAALADLAARDILDRPLA